MNADRSVTGFFRRFGFWSRRLVVISFTAAQFVSHSAPADGAIRSGGKGDLLPITRSIDLLGEVYSEVTQNYVDTVDASQFMYAGIDGMLDQLDPYSTFLDEEQSGELDEMTSGRYAGIGITIGLISGDLYVTTVFEGQVAAQAGLQVGDRIIAVNGTRVNRQSIDQVRNSIKGSPGSVVTLLVRKDGQGATKLYTLTRGEVRVSTVPYAALFGASGYVRLNSFGAHTVQELRSAIRTLQKQAIQEHTAMNGLVLDLRGNPGGLLNAAVDVASLFVEKGSTVVSTRGRAAESGQAFVTRTEPLLPTLPLIVLIDGESASASEIVSAAIQELDRGIILGEGSFGKGLVQSIIGLPFDHTLKLTTAKYYTPSGRLIQKPIAKGDEQRKVLLNPVSCDSTKVFYTRNRRKVFGGGGIRPDVTVRAESPSGYEKALEKEGFVFRYVSRFHFRHPGYQLRKLAGEPLFRDFSDFVSDEHFVYRSKAQRNLDSLKVLIKKDGGAENPALASRLDDFSKELADWTLRRLERDSTRISATLRREIMRRYDERAAMHQSVADDPVAAKAFTLLADPTGYQALLRP